MKKLENELETIRKHLVEMGNVTERMVRVVTDAICEVPNAEIPHSLYEDENRVDLMQLNIDKEAIRLLTVYSPVAGDLRMIMTISRLTAELERIGDHAVNVMESIQLIQKHGDVEVLPSIQRMGTMVMTMVHDALNAFARSDMDKARATIANDNIVDAMNDQVMGELLSFETVRKVVEGASDIAGPFGQLLIARSLERIADQATNVSEEVVYMVKGDDIRHAPIHNR